MPEDFSPLRFRTLQQFKDQYTHVWDSDKAPDLANFLERLAAFLELLIKDPDEFTVGSVSEEHIDLRIQPGPIIPVAGIYQFASQFARERHVEVRIGATLGFKQVLITEESKRLVDALSSTLLALDLAVDAPNVYVHQHTSRIPPPKCLAWSIWRGTPYVIWLPWPSIEANGPTETVRRVEDWAQDVRNIDYTGGDTWVDRIAFTWIRLHLLWLGADEGKLPNPLKIDSDINDAWKKLFQSFKLLEDKVKRSLWFRLGLPLLTAPEYGLSKDLQEKLLEALLRERQGVQDLAKEWEEWQEFRRKSIDTATKFTQDLEPADWFEVNPYDSERAVPDSVFDLLEEVQNVFPAIPARP